MAMHPRDLAGAIQARRGGGGASPPPQVVPTLDDRTPEEIVEIEQRYGEALADTAGLPPVFVKARPGVEVRPYSISLAANIVSLDSGEVVIDGQSFVATPSELEQIIAVVLSGLERSLREKAQKIREKRLAAVQSPQLPAVPTPGPEAVRGAHADGARVETTVAEIALDGTVS